MTKPPGIFVKVRIIAHPEAFRLDSRISGRRQIADLGKEPVPAGPIWTSKSRRDGYGMAWQLVTATRSLGIRGRLSASAERRKNIHAGRRFPGGYELNAWSNTSSVLQG